MSSINTKLVKPFLILGTLLAILLASCSPSPAGQTPSPLPSEVVVLPTPLVRTTSTPPLDSAVNAFLGAWQNQDFLTMYSLLSSESQDAISREQFEKKYQDFADELALNGIDYQINNVDNETGVAQSSIIFHSNLIGDVIGNSEMKLLFENNGWVVDWDDSTIMTELAGGNTLRMDINPPGRASIFDRNGNPLAYQTEATSIGLISDYVDPEQSDGLFALLGRITGLHPATFAAKVENANPGDYIPIGEVSTQDFQGLLNALASYGAVVLSNYTSRFYPGNGTAPHLIGYVSAIQKEELSEYRRKGYRIDEKVGRKGIEGWGDNILGGDSDASLYLIDPTGTPIQKLGSTAGNPGSTIFSTIDRDLQQGVQQALNGFRGAAVVLERDTGRVLAMASSPGFDSNAYQSENYNWLTQLGGIANDPNLPQFNRATTGQYPLGSVFKLITSAAGLESGIFTPDYTYDCQYEFNEYDGVTLYDWTYTEFQEDGETPPSGLLTYPEGLIRSCNPFFWHISKALYDNGLTTAISEMARGFGLGSKTGIGVVAEEAGKIPDPVSQLDAANLAIGEGDMQVTPLQVARFIAAIGNGGNLLKPQAIEKIVSANGQVSDEFKTEITGRLPIKEATLKLLQDAMRGVAVNKNPRGTAFLVFNGFDIPVHGKTGTADNGTPDPHAWFAGYTNAQREDKPDIAIVVLAENAGQGSEIAAPIFRRIVEYYFFGRPQRLYPWESGIGITKTPTSLFTETPLPEVYP